MKPELNKHLHINSNGTAVIPVSNNTNNRLLLKAIVVNTKGGSSNKATIYDSNEDIGVDASRIIGILDTTANVGRVNYDIPIYKGIYIVVDVGTAPDLTVLYNETP